ncbi:uncharacterized protein LOC128414804 isoform X2 [Podarcis raffonei]|uniref:uncharacterized protein LOC128414804 isoform X2 n=1 Tax=Podarcis raffonei TaxID=65483 RepID=UPI0023292651|nr:uncharacterized protein LOC128414804 isoform X2 [Podarcis raffonei]XP_053246603.1 uncharacterized protein LOC128414804 isoform X2 [Podarcis raffonei]XP_053246604.1 uncharacterized protein LOC128414804 isoform X2 [Podarcis raffonei]
MCRQPGLPGEEKRNWIHSGWRRRGRLERGGWRGWGAREGSLRASASAAVRGKVLQAPEEAELGRRSPRGLCLPSANQTPSEPRAQSGVAETCVLLGNNSSSPHSSLAVSLTLVLQRKRQGVHLTSEDFRYLQGDLNDFNMLNLQLYIHLLGVIGTSFSEQTLPNSGVPKLFSKRARFDKVNMREGRPKFLSFFKDFTPGHILPGARLN